MRAIISEMAPKPQGLLIEANARSINNATFVCLKLIVTQMYNSFKQSLASLSTRWSGIDTREVRVGFVVDKVALGMVFFFLRVHQFPPPPPIISPVLLPVFIYLLQPTLCTRLEWIKSHYLKPLKTTYSLLHVSILTVSSSGRSIPY